MPTTGVLRCFRGSSLHWPRSCHGLSRVQQHRRYSALPRIVQPSLWSSIIPKYFRKGTQGEAPDTKVRSKEWNPATFFIVMSLLIGSNAIQMIALKTQRLNYSRSTEAKLSLLRKVIDKVQRGENVNVEEMLGTGDPEREREWEEVMRDLRNEEDFAAKAAAKAEARRIKKQAEAQGVQESGQRRSTDTAASAYKEDESRKPGFY